jgi:hypothetical protein
VWAALRQAEEISIPPMSDPIQAPVIRLHPRCLAFYVDESGHEDFSDPGYPVYALGGCAILAADLIHVVREPWRELKARHFGGAVQPLHASSLRNLTVVQMEALGAYFRAQSFGRFAAVMTSKTTLPPGTKPIEIMPSLLRKRYEALTPRLAPQLTEVAFIHEASDRGDPLLEKYFGATVVTVDGQQIPAHHLLMPKGDEALEVADFVVHAAGAQARGWSQGKPIRKDFEAVFHSHPRLTSFISVDRAAGREWAI